ncbi:MAG TPA: ester cyclase, partial [Acidimicrobiales bacterium]
MSLEDNKAIARRFIRVWDTDDPRVFDELAATDIRISYPILPGPIRGVEAFKVVLAGVRAALPDIAIEIDDVIAEGEFVVAPWTMSGTHLGELMGIPPTGKRVAWRGITIYRIEDGKV